MTMLSRVRFSPAAWVARIQYPAGPNDRMLELLGPRVADAGNLCKSMVSLDTDISNMKAERSRLLSKSFQSQAAENIEFFTLVLCAFSGALGVSVHPIFLSLYGVSYIIYKRTTNATIVREKALQSAEEMEVTLREKHVALQEFQKQWTELRMKHNLPEVPDPPIIK
eukprot:GEMP01111169.1.p1 GENE.GEMP01111169.1~~GEMP01111169.1.p1  ORF type:complete len:167 (+),score=25.57 GEMP01111169.1:173-673(+)